MRLSRPQSEIPIPLQDVIKQELPLESLLEGGQYKQSDFNSKGPFSLKGVL